MKHQNWIKSPLRIEGAALSFQKSFIVDKAVKKATLCVSSMGVYRARLNGSKLGKQVLTPGLTSYDSRIQYQTFDITDKLKDNNTLDITVAPGWGVGHYNYHVDTCLYGNEVSTVAELCLEMSDGSLEYICTDNTWQVYTTEVTYADIYMGETVDKIAEQKLLGNAISADKAYNLIPQVGADIVENEVLSPIELIITPKGERVIDFGQNMTGYISLKIKGKKGDRVVITHAEVLDKDGNFYNANYRKAKNILTFVLDGEENYFKPEFSFQGFRYIRLDEYPLDTVDLSGFKAIAVHSKMARTGRFVCGNDRINQLYHNIIWGQKGNYLDIPTDCPQRDERLGWTGDAQVFCHTAAINFDVRKFFEKWLGDLRIEQREDGAVKGTCPERFNNGYKTRISAGWGDVATVVPWTMYEIYNDKSFLADNLEMMQRWVEYIRHTGTEEFLWLTGCHYGDWLAMDGDEDSYMGVTSFDLIATVFYAYSCELLVKAGEAIDKDMSEYRTLLANIKKRFREYFMENGFPKAELPYTEVLPPDRTTPVGQLSTKGMTQTALVLILHFNMCLPEERGAIADKLEEMIHDFGNRMTTGFLGTPYILHALSAEGRNETAYKLFFQNKDPSWLYSIDHGATTIWEHWNGIKEDGSFWSTDMNSFNHYAYGAVAEWMYGTICGVKLLEAGYKKILLAPVPNKELGFAKCAIETVSGRIESHWYYSNGKIMFEFTVPEGVKAKIMLPNGYTESVTGGSYTYAIEQ